jgi:hypothetical protein
LHAMRYLIIPPPATANCLSFLNLPATGTQ